MEKTAVTVTWLCLVLTSASSETIEVMKGKTVAIQCPTITGSGGVAELWIHPSGLQLPVPSSTLNSTYLTNVTSLTIKEAAERDAGSFTCVGRAGQRLTYGSVEVVIKSSDVPYWQRHETNLLLAFVAAVIFVLLATGIFLVHQYRYEKRHKLDGKVNGDNLKGGLSNPALDIEAETHM